MIYTIGESLEGLETFTLIDTFGTYLYFKQKIRDSLVCVPHYVSRYYNQNYTHLPKYQGSMFEINSKFNWCSIRMIGDIENFQFKFPFHPSQIKEFKDEVIGEHNFIDDVLTKETYIYLIKDSDTGFIKIGRSGNPYKRLNELKKQDTLMPKANDFRLVDFWEDSPHTEQLLHNEFNAKRVRGEWFNLSDLDIKNVMGFAETRRS